MTPESAADAPGQPLAEPSAESAPQRVAAPSAARPWWRVEPATLAALAICMAGLALRLQIAAYGRDAPHIDEKDVVEQAVAFMGGDLRYYFLRYGPLTMYLLAGIYHVLAALHGLSAIDYAARVFFDGAEQYFVARVVAGLALTSLALLAFRHFRRDYGAPAALLVCSLLALPVVDILAYGVRIDVLQAAFQSAALLALGEAALRSRLRDWVSAGVCAGLAIATKPLPGLLVLPCFVLASWLSARLTREGTPRRPLARLGRTVACPGAWLAALCCCGCAVLCNPAMLDLRHFVEVQREAIDLHTGNVTFSTQSIGASFSRLGLPFVLCLGLSLAIAVARRSPKALLVAAFVVTYVGAFWSSPSRDYYMVAPAVAACLLIGHGFALAARWLPSERQRWLGWAWAPLALALLSSPVLSIEAAISEPWDASLAREWIESNIPLGTRMTYVGMRMQGPRLVSMDEQHQKQWSHSFDYGRKKYIFFRQAFRKAYEDYAASGRPRYEISSRAEKPLRRGSPRVPKDISDGLLRKARKRHDGYIILSGIGAYDVRDLGYTWFDGVTLERQFGRIAIFRVPEEPNTASSP